MGSKSDWDTMRQAAEILTKFGVAHEARVMSAHRTPADTAAYASNAIASGLEVIIAGAGGAAHLAGVIAAHTVLPVIGVPVTSALNGLDSLLSTVQMPKGIPVATVAIGPAGAANAGLLAVAILATSRPDLAAKLQAYRGRARRPGAPAVARVMAHSLLPAAACAARSPAAHSSRSPSPPTHQSVRKPTNPACHSTSTISRRPSIDGPSFVSCVPPSRGAQRPPRAMPPG